MVRRYIVEIGLGGDTNCDVRIEPFAGGCRGEIGYVVYKSLLNVAPETYLNDMLAEPFKAFTFSVTGAAVYQLGSFGAARKELQALSLTL